MKIIVAITAASGQIYARQVVQLLIESALVSEIALIYSSHAEGVAQQEGVEMPESAKITRYSNTDLYAPMASGSTEWDSMVIVPCSAGTMSRVSNGISETLITRAADVMIKERRGLVIVLRETPLSLIHLRNMVQLAESGVIVMPASPNFYGGEETIEELARSVSTRVVRQLGLRGVVREWGGGK